MSSAFRVLIADSMSSKAAEVLGASAAVEVDDRAGIPADELVSAISEYNGLIVRSRTKVTAEVLAAGSKLKVVGRAGIGVDNIDLAAASKNGIIVENAPSGNSVTTAEHALCLLLSLARHIPQATASMKNGRWDKKKYQGVELCDKTLGIVGLGNIGSIVADRARGLHMKVIASDPFADKARAEKVGAELVEFDELLARADFITIHTALVDATRGLFGAEAFAKTKRGLLLVNAARGGIVDEAALLAAIEEGQVAGAALDVFEHEPPPDGYALVNHPHVICSPHLGASTAEAQDKVAIEIAEQMVAFAESGEVRNQVNK
jgi:D-3-phosphoglycerate dehydrogenase